MIPVLYEKINGVGGTSICSLSDCVSCLVTEERNGDYILDIEYAEGGYAESELKPLRQILVETNDGNLQFFDIATVTRKSGQNTEVSARHVSYRYGGIPVRTNRGGTWLEANTAADAFNSMMSYVPDPYYADVAATFYSDVPTQRTWKPERPASILSMLMDGDGSILGTYGGELLFDNKNVSLLASRGEDRGVTIRYGKNITDITDDVTIDGSYNGVYGYWEKGDSYYFPSAGSLIENSNIPYSFAKVADFTNEFETKPTYAQLLARDEEEQSGKDVDQLSITVSLSTGYSDAIGDTTPLETVKLCDTVHVIYEPYGIEVSTKVVKTVYDVLLSRLESVEIGTIKTTLADAIAEGSRGISTYISGGEGGDYEARVSALEEATASLTATVSALSLNTLGAQRLGSVGTSQSTISLPEATAAYIIVTTHNSTTGNNAMWIVRGTSGVFKIGGGSNITITKSSATLTVKSTSGNSDLYAIKLN